jgi:hypothetical protein
VAENLKKQMGGRRAGSGRKKGGKNKATIIRETKQAEVIARTIDSGKPMAIEVLQKAMEFAEGAVAAFKPTLAAEKAAGARENPDGNVEEFGRWFDRWFKVASDLASYQSAKIKPIDAPTPAPKAGEGKRRFTLHVFEGGRPPAIGKPANDEDAA